MLKTCKMLLCAASFICLTIMADAQNAPAPATQILAPGVSRVTSPPVGKTAEQTRRAGADPVDDRVEIREYGFKETGENMPYAVFVSSKITKGQKAPLVLALHGYLGNYGTFMRSGCVEEAEKNGYILVGVMGYSPTAPFGNTNMFRGRGPTTGPAPTGAPKVMPGGPAPAGAPKMMPGSFGPPIGGTKETDPAKVSELSEIDTMRVLELVRKEFNIDDNRIFLMGHSMGGAGALYIGEKYAQIWAAVGCIAGFGSPDPKGKLKDTPLYFTAGSKDTLGAMGRTTAEQLKAAGLDVQWKEIPDLDHGSIIAGSMPDVFKFFNEHPRKSGK
jgi:poly(3-hydroxybutyrate) depolymerase